MAKATQFRTCPTTGLKVDLAAEKLIKANAVVAVVFLAIGGLFGLLVALTRWPAVHFLPADWFYLALTAHGFDVLLVWIIFFEMAVLYFASSVLLGCRLAGPRWAWTGFALMLIGAVVTNIVVLQGQSSVMFTSYVPMKAEPGFYLGIILFAVGALIGCFVFFGTLVVARQEKTYQGSVPLVTFGAITAAIIAVFTIASGAIILIPTLLWSVGLVSHIDPLVYKTIWWAMGHSSQQINVSAHVAVWYAIAAMVLGARPISEKVSRMAFLMYILFLQLASAHHMLVEPGFSSEWKIFNTSYAMYLAVLGSMIHGMTVPGSIEAAQRARGLTKGLFEWLRKAPWGNPAFAGMFMSLVGDYLPARAADIPARADVPEARAMAAIPVRYRRRGDIGLHDGSRNAGRVASALGHDLRRRPAAVRLPVRRVPDDGAERDLRHTGGTRRHSVYPHRRRIGFLRQEAG
jgi:cytochrome c oxidase subunit 1